MGDGESALRVLVVDDEPDIRLVLRVSLELDGEFAVVGEAANGLEAVDLAGTLLPDVVILDVMMPVLNGVHALPRIVEAAPGATVVMLTAAWGEEVEFTALAAGAAACFDKSLTISNIAAAVKALVPRR